VTATQQTGPRRWSPDKRARDREESVLEIGGFELHPRRKTNQLSAEVQILAVRSQEIAEEMSRLPDDAPLDPERVRVFNDLMYDQISLMTHVGREIVEGDVADGESPVHGLRLWQKTFPGAEGEPDVVKFVDEDTEGAEEVPVKNSDGTPNTTWLKEALDVEDASPALAFLMGRDPEKVIEAIRKQQDRAEDEAMTEEESPQAGSSTPSPSPTPTSPASEQTNASPASSPEPQQLPPASELPPATAVPS
jgi:hypothetical protein